MIFLPSIATTKLTRLDLYPPSLLMAQQVLSKAHIMVPTQMTPLIVVARQAWLTAYHQLMMCHTILMTKITLMFLVSPSTKLGQLSATPFWDWSIFTTKGSFTEILNQQIYYGRKITESRSRTSGFLTSGGQSDQARLKRIFQKPMPPISMTTWNLPRPLAHQHSSPPS